MSISKSFLVNLTTFLLHLFILYKDVEDPRHRPVCKSKRGVFKCSKKIRTTCKGKRCLKYKQCARCNRRRACKKHRGKLMCKCLYSRCFYYAKALRFYSRKSG